MADTYCVDVRIVEYGRATLVVLPDDLRFSASRGHDARGQSP
jgi:hypothetical protein